MQSNMRLKQMLFLAALVVVMTSCPNGNTSWIDNNKNSDFYEAEPEGMVFIKRGAFMMGANTQSAIFEQPDNIKMVTVDAFWMDATEITNRQYKLFVNWVRDSIAMTRLVEAGMTDFAVQPAKGEDFDEENYVLNWRSKTPIPWNSTEDEAKDALAPMFFEDSKTLRTNGLHYRYQWYNYDQAVLPQNKFDVATSSYPENARVQVDTFWVDENGSIQCETIERPLRGPKDLITQKNHLRLSRHVGLDARFPILFQRAYAAHVFLA